MTHKEIPTLYYTEASKSAVPLLSGEQNLQTVTAEPWLKFQTKDFNLKVYVSTETIIYFV